MKGGTALVQEGPYDAVDTTRWNINTRETGYVKDGKIVRSARAVTSNDGKTMKVTVKGTDAQGKPVAGVSVFEKQ